MITHGHTSKKRNGDKRLSAEWTTWRSMIERCSDPTKKSHYGLPIHSPWMDFGNFLQDMGLKPSPSHTIDRIDGSKGYFPWNCRFDDLVPEERKPLIVKFKPNLPPPTREAVRNLSA